MTVIQKDEPWLARVGERLLKRIIVAFIVIAASGTAWLLDSPGVTMALIGAAAMWLGFVLGVWCIRALLSPGWPVLGVARTLIDEAVRMKIVAVFGFGLLVFVPFLPFLLDPNEQLRYRVQFFLTWALSGTSVLMSVMTLFLACTTICNEIEKKRIFLTLTKPIGRGQYLLGKWLGIALLNLLLISVAGVGIYVFAKVLAQQEARDAYDRRAVGRQVLTARRSVGAEPPAGMDLSALVDERYKQLRTRDTGPYPQQDTDTQLRRAIEQAVVAKWHTIPPRDTQRYLFTQLHDAKRVDGWLQLRIKPVSSVEPPDRLVRLALWLNGRPYPVDPRIGRQLPLVVADNHFHVIDLPVSAIDDEGRLELRIGNVNLVNPHATHASSVNLAPGTGLELLYQAGRFEPNLVRGLGLIWLRLGFLAMIGLAAGSLLDFHVACLLSLLVYITATANTFLAESMQYYVTIPRTEMSLVEMALWWPQVFIDRLIQGEVWGAAKVVIRLIGNTFVLLVPSFSKYNPVPLIADGRLVGYGVLGEATVWVGLIWTGSCGVIGWLMLRGRELARVTV